MNSTTASPAAIAIYCATAQNEAMACLGWCPNPGIGGIGARSAAFAQAIISGYSITWLEPSDARSVYYVQSLSSVSLVVIGYLYGGFLSDKTVTAYHALLIVYLSMGNVISAAVAFHMGIFFEKMTQLALFIMSVGVFAVSLTFMMMASTTKRAFGSQPECNSQLVQSPFHIPLGIILFLLAIVPWIVSIVSLHTASRFSRQNDQGSSTRSLPWCLFWSLFLAIYYAAWIYLTESYIYKQKVQVLTNSERRFTQDQVQALSLAIITSCFPLRAIGNGFMAYLNPPTRQSSPAPDEIPLYPKRNGDATP